MIENYEDFNEEQIKVLEKYVTNTSSNIFVLRNLPEVIKGALFSRYSRSSLGLRSLLLKEFIGNEDMAFEEVSGNYEQMSSEGQVLAIKKAQSFYDRILDGYGDDSIGELGGAHLAVENVSMLAAKELEDSRVGGSPLEKSTRYIYFDQKCNGEYLFYQEPIIMTSAFRDLYLTTCNDLFETYSRLIPPLMKKIEGEFPRDHGISKIAYTASLRAKVLDCLRGLLPSAALTNMGVFGNGRFFENLIQKMHAHNLAEMQDVGKKTHQELCKVIPSFVRRADVNHHHYQAFALFKEEMTAELQQLGKRVEEDVPSHKQAGVRLAHFDKEGVYRVAAALLFDHTKCSFDSLVEYMKKQPEEDLLQILDAACNHRENRRHKSPRALEHASFTFEVVADFAIYRDLQRHRMLSQGRQFLTCDYGYFIPQEITGTEMEKEYIDALEKAKVAYDTIAQELPEEAQYVVPMAYNVRWYFHVNLRALQWLCELRSSPAGHPSYRYVAQEMARQACEAEPQFERFFKFVDFDGYELGRLGAEVRQEEKAQKS